MNEGYLRVSYGQKGAWKYEVRMSRESYKVSECSFGFDNFSDIMGATMRNYHQFVGGEHISPAMNRMNFEVEGELPKTERDSFEGIVNMHNRMYEIYQNLGRNSQIHQAQLAEDRMRE